MITVDPSRLMRLTSFLFMWSTEGTGTVKTVILLEKKNKFEVTNGANNQLF
jgi:hypothetical protein